MNFTVWHYFYQYLKTNQFTFYFALFLFVLSIGKYLSIRVPRALLDKRKALILVVLLGLVLRVFWLGFSSHIPKTEWKMPFIEEDRINMHAIELTKGIWFLEPPGVSPDGDRPPSGHRPIGYPMVLGTVYKIFGTNTVNAWVLQLILYAAATCLIFGIARMLFSSRVGIMAALFFSIYPISIYSVKLTCDEHLFLPVWYLGIYLLLKEINGKRYVLSWLWYGLIFGYATMTRTHAIFMPLVLGFAYILGKFPRKKIISTVLLTVAVMQIINLPWVVRNYKAWGVPVVYTTNLNYLYACVNSTATPEGEGWIPREGDEGYSEELSKLVAEDRNPGMIHKLSSREMTRWIVMHPKEFMVLGISRLLVFMEWNRRFGTWPFLSQFYEGSYDPSRPMEGRLRYVLEELAYATYYALFYAFLFAIFLMAFRWKRIKPLSRIGILTVGSCLSFWLLEHMVIYPDRKYRFPIEPLMMIFACYFFDHVMRTFRWEDAFRKVRSVLSRPR
ncbi:MAG: glycosyltransferase family 39 protein [Candidatus Omnitrophica bacterium]|nr:glycosyltransferase family 39 protein [Candidatus Omnitrophota bacterium]